MTLHLHTAERTDALADGLAAMLATPLADPFAREVVVVPARGVERWLTQRLSHRLGVGPAGGDGVCAGVDFLTPHSLVSLLLDSDRDDPWDPDQVVWPLLDVIDEAVGDSGLRDALTTPRPRRPQRARRDRRAGATPSPGASRASSPPTPASARRWSPSGARATTPTARAARSTPTCTGRPSCGAAWSAGWTCRRPTSATPPPGGTALRRRDLELPPRLSLFGHTRLPVTEVELLARTRHPARGAPVAAAGLRLPLARPRELTSDGPVLRELDTSAAAVGHPLLASLGRDSRELRRTLGAVEAVDEPVGGVDRDPRHPARLAPARPARQLPPDVAIARRAVTTAWTARSRCTPATARRARSTSCARCWSGLLQDDPTLEPRDILVMCPDIESYAPLVSAGFGLADLAQGGSGHPAHQLRVRLADRRSAPPTPCSRWPPRWSSSPAAG